MEDSEMMNGNGKRAYCVTGANGYIGSWLVQLLLQNGHTVHATVRDPAKSTQLSSLWNGGKRLRMFKADLQEEGSFDEAVQGCHGVFHVAASMELCTLQNPNFEEYVQSNMIEPAIKGTLNLLKSCTKSKSVKRVVFTSSISTLTAKDSTGNWRKVVDETCQTPIDHVLNAKASGWVYVVSKLRTEEAAFKFAKQNGIDLVSVITSTVGGSFLTSAVPSSVQLILSPLTGDSKFFSILSAVNDRMGAIALVHIEDICNAHLFVMNHTQAQGRYLCTSNTCLITHLVNLLKQRYPCSTIHRFAGELINEGSISMPCEISSKKLRDLGFNYKHEIKDIIHQTIACCVDYGFLPPLSNFT